MTPKERRKAKAAARPHFVYLISGGGLLKIGYSGDIRRRMTGMRADCPVAIELLHRWEFAHLYAAQEFERGLHTILAPAKVRGEWHDVTLAFALDAAAALMSREASRVKAVIAELRDLRDPVQEQNREFDGRLTAT